MRRAIVLFTLIAATVIVGTGAPAWSDSGTLVAYMSGANERPNAGDPDGVGRAVITVNDDTNTVCVALQFTGVDLPLTGFHIHLAPPTSAGPVVIPFTPPQSQSSYQCVAVENEALLDNIVASPQQYYINIHNASYPGGALRGQLQAG